MSPVPQYSSTFESLLHKICTPHSIDPPQPSSFVHSHTISVFPFISLSASDTCVNLYKHMRQALGHPAFFLRFYPPLSSPMCSSTSFPLAMLSVDFNLCLPMKPEEVVNQGRMITIDFLLVIFELSDNFTWGTRALFLNIELKPRQNKPII